MTLWNHIFQFRLLGIIRDLIKVFNASLPYVRQHQTKSFKFIFRWSIIPSTNITRKFVVLIYHAFHEVLVKFLKVFKLLCHPPPNPSPPPHSHKTNNKVFSDEKFMTWFIYLYRWYKWCNLCLKGLPLQHLMMSHFSSSLN